MDAKIIRLAAGQILVEGGRCDENLRRATDAIRDAAEENCQVIVLPVPASMPVTSQ